MDKNLVSTHELFPLVREILNQGNKVKFTVSGSSMLPWIVDNRDQVLVDGLHDDLKVGDIILFRNRDGEYILHRIYKKEKGYYLTIGDSCYINDGKIFYRDIIGVVKIIYRKNITIDCNSPIWKVIFLIWRKLFPIRKWLMRFYHIVVRIRRIRIVKRTGRNYERNM